MNIQRTPPVQPTTMRLFITCAALAVTAPFSPARADAKTIEVFVALCDNGSQGIAPVPEKIGDGDLKAGKTDCSVGGER